MLLEILMTPFTIERIKDMKPQDDIRLKSSKSQSLMYRKVGLKPYLTLSHSTLDFSGMNTTGILGLAFLFTRLWGMGLSKSVIELFEARS